MPNGAGGAVALPFISLFDEQKAVTCENHLAKIRPFCRISSATGLLVSEELFCGRAFFGAGSAPEGETKSAIHAVGLSRGFPSNSRRESFGTRAREIGVE